MQKLGADGMQPNSICIKIGNKPWKQNELHTATATT